MASYYSLKLIKKQKKQKKGGKGKENGKKKKGKGKGKGKEHDNPGGAGKGKGQRGKDGKWKNGEKKTAKHPALGGERKRAKAKAGEKAKRVSSARCMFSTHFQARTSGEDVACQQPSQ